MTNIPNRSDERNENPNKILPFGGGKTPTNDTCGEANASPDAASFSDDCTVDYSWLPPPFEAGWSLRDAEAHGGLPDLASWIEYPVAGRDRVGGTVEPLVSAIEILAASRNAAGGGWGFHVRVLNRDRVWSSIDIPATWTAGDGLRIREALLDAGARLGSHPEVNAKLVQLFRDVRPIRRAVNVSRLGWLADGVDIYVLPDGAIGDTGDELVCWRPAAGAEHRHHITGTLDEWRASVAAPAVGNSRLILGLCAAFAAPLLGRLGMEGGGFHLRGPSSVGKTTALRVAGSVWGGPTYHRTWSATGNGLEGIALAHNDGLLCLDELGQLPAREAAAVAYMLANGQGKQRAGRSGDARATATWRTMVLSTGEIGLADKLAEDGGRALTAGQAVRLVDIEADAGQGLGLFDVLGAAPTATDLAQRLAVATREFHGTAGPEFVRLFLQAPGEYLGAARDIMREFVRAASLPSAEGQVLRVLDRFAALAAAGELAASFGLLPWETGEAVSGMQRCWTAWLSARGGLGNLEAERAVRQVRAFLESHGTSRFAPLGSPDNNVRDRVGFHESDGEGVMFYVMNEAWNEVCMGLDPQAVAKVLADRGYLKPEDGRGFQRRKRVQGLGRLRVYAISGAIMDQDRGS